MILYLLAFCEIMADLSNSVKQKFELLFGMKSGYVLDFNNVSFQDFIATSININVDDEDKYIGSKAQRLRQLWQKESDKAVAKLMLEMLERWQTNKLMDNSDISKNEALLYEQCKQETEKLLGQTLGKVNSQKSSLNRQDYINPDLIEKFNNKNNKFNYTKLVGILKDLNMSYQQRNHYACSQLVKALVNHIPPLLGNYKTFKDASSQFSWERAHKPYIKAIGTYIDEANDVTHTVISAYEDQASLESLPKSVHINTILAICLVESDKHSPIVASKTKKTNSQKSEVLSESESPQIFLVEPYAVWASNYAKYGASFLVVISVDNYGGKNDFITNAQIIGTNAIGTSFKTDRFAFEDKQPDYPYPVKAGDMETLRLFIASDYSNHRPMPDLDRDKVRLSLVFRSGKKISLPIKIRPN